MRTPRLEIRLDQLGHNAATLVRRLGRRGIDVCAVTKATLGSPQIARVLSAAGAASLGDARIDNIEALRSAGLREEMMLVRGPLLGEVERVVAHADLSCNSEPGVIARLSEVARHRRRTHGVVLMVELGDLREGIMPADLVEIARSTIALPGVVLRGIGTNLACQSGVVPDADKMAELSELATMLETTFSIDLDTISGGNSANLAWALDPRSDVGRVNHLRIGEAILLGREPSERTPIDGLYTEAITLVAEVIESKTKPSRPWGTIAQTAFGAAKPAPHHGPMHRVILAVGHQDIDPADLTPPEGFEILGASSDHLVLDAGDHDDVAVGAELRLGLGYSALLRAMTSPFVRTDYVSPHVGV